MWEGALFALQLCGLWILIYWFMNDERAGGKAETGLLAVRRVRDKVAPNTKLGDTKLGRRTGRR